MTYVFRPQRRFDHFCWPYTAMVIGTFDFHYGVSYWCSIVTIAVKSTVFELGACNRRTDRQTDGKHLRSVPSIHFGGRGIKPSESPLTRCYYWYIKNFRNGLPLLQKCTRVAWWLSGRALDLRFTGRGFNSRPVAFT